MTSGKDSKGSAAVLQSTTEHRLRDMLFAKMSGGKKDALELIDENEQRMAVKNMLQQFILQKQALLTPPELLKSNLDSFKEIIIEADNALKEAESQLANDILWLFDDFDKHAHQLQKQAVVQMLLKVENCYYANYHNCTPVVASVLQASLQEGAAQVIAPLYHHMNEYLENRFNNYQQCFLDRIRKLTENLYRQAAELFGLYWGGEIMMPLMIDQHRDDSMDREPIFNESLPLPVTDTLPSSILNPLVLQEIKMRITIEMEKTYQGLHFYYHEHLEQSFCELRDHMRVIVEEAKNQIQLQLDNAVTEREGSHDNLALKLTELEHQIYALHQMTLNSIPNENE